VTAAVRLQVRVTGQVQQVGFRVFTRQAAQTLGVNGVVRNTGDGGVEVIAEGERPALERLLAQVRTGPGAARVEGVLVSWSAATGVFRGFGVEAARF